LARLIILDSDVIIDLLRKNKSRSEEITERISISGETDIRISSIVLEEVLYGIIKQTSTENVSEHSIFSYPVIAFGKEEALKAAEIEVEMERQDIKKPRGDVLIAASAICNNALLFTFNKKHYQDIPELRLL
jgi:predicted nucleic acid-binding protein